MHFTTEKLGSEWGYGNYVLQTELVHDPVKNTQYLKDNTLHFRVLVEVTTETTRKLQETVAKLQHELQNRSITLKKNESMTFAMPQYQKKKKGNEIFISPSFYSSPNGYHMAVRVYANGHGDSKDTHVSVYAVILEGKYDAGLKWPFIRKVHFTLLNQLEDKNHYNRTVPFTAVANKHVGSEVYGYHQFIPHSLLAHDPVKNTQYLKDDTLYFRVSVDPEVAESKPWLECTAQS